ncbi:unnamed protein product, partial [Ixodes hexagonus]
MPARCCVPNCGYRFHINKDDKVALHGLPKDPKRRELWLKAIALDRPVGLRFAKVCSRHFLEDDYLKKIASGMKILRDNAVPSVFKNRPPLPQPASSPEQSNSAAATSPTSEQRSADVSSDPTNDSPDLPDTTAIGTDAQIRDLHTYAKNFICMLRNSGHTGSKHRQHKVSTTENSSSKPQYVASTNSGDRLNKDAMTDEETSEDIHRYSETLISTLRNAVAIDPGALQCASVTDDDDDEPAPEQYQEENCRSDVSPTHRDSATSPHQLYVDAATSPHQLYADAATSPHQCYEDVATSPDQCYEDAATSPHHYEEATNDGLAMDCAEDVPLQDSSDVESEDEVSQPEKLQYAKHKVAWLRSALTKKDKRVQELEQQCAALRKEAIALRQRVWLYEAQERYKLKES